ncbi:unnamed protein product [Lactuca saligna]|uniref:Uncharacterized protein n=1 Tax=Lactuca saligna TaxID=75948 RepID=A0AA35YJ23_LACSI|nr:unnamed protein product [Lactuca saligna]
MSKRTCDLQDLELLATLHGLSPVVGDHQSSGNGSNGGVDQESTSDDHMLQRRKRRMEAGNSEDVSIVDNATIATTIILQRVGWAFTEGRFNKGDAVVMLHYAFQVVKKFIEAYVTHAGGSVIVVHFSFHIHSKEEIISEFRKGLTRGKAYDRKIRLAIIDHITSMPSLLILVLSHKTQGTSGLAKTAPLPLRCFTLVSLENTISHSLSSHRLWNKREAQPQQRRQTLNTTAILLGDSSANRR